MLTREERRHQADMIMTYKILTGKEDVDHSEWFVMAAEAGRSTRSASDPLNVRVKHGRLDIRKHVFSVRVTEAWNAVPREIKGLKTVNGFKDAFAKYRKNTAPLGYD